MLMIFYKEKIEEVLRYLDSSESGLPTEQIRLRQQKFGKNVISIKGESLFKKIIEPFKSVFVLILVIAAVISLIQKEALDAVIVIIIVLISAIIFYIQKFSTEKVLKSLRKQDKQLVKTMRGGNILEINKEDLVPGDIIYLAEGEKVPADARIIHAESLRCDESILTGESKPISKQPQPLEVEKEIYEQSNILFQGTFIIAGNAKSVVFATGNKTEFGRIAGLATDKNESPVQAKIDKLITQIIIAVSIVALIAFILSMYRGISLGESIRFVLSLTVSAVPEGLPVAVSVILVIGMRRMAKQKALFRNMSAIENIGTVTMIATDKTGTLTKNLLTVQDIWQLEDRDLKSTCQKIALGVNAKEGVVHDPLDGAMQVFAQKYIDKSIKSSELVKLLPFELSYAMSGNIWKIDNDYWLVLKGAPEKIVELCRVDEKERTTIHQAVFDLTSDGYRVIALAYLKSDKPQIEHFRDVASKSLTFEALIAVADELRPDSKRAIAKTLKAGVKVSMITGDHFETAFAIAKKLGLAQNRNQVFDTRKMSSMSDNQLIKFVKDIRVFSRVIPENKFRLLEIFKKTDIVAMTGDGVNDVPALTSAHIGISMGSGSQIAKDAGDIVLLNNRFSAITSALKEGRQVYDNIRRMLFYLLSTNLGEVMITIGALIMGMPLPLMPVQILWVNLVTDTCLVIPLGLEPSDNAVLDRPPRRAAKPVIGRRSITRLLIIALAMTITGLAVFNFYLQNHSVEYSRTVAFMIIVVMQWANAFNARSEWRSILKPRRFNLSFMIGIALALILQIIVLFGPLAKALHTVEVGVMDLLVTSTASFVIIIIVDEIFKLVYKSRPKLTALKNSESI